MAPRARLEEAATADHAVFIAETSMLLVKGVARIWFRGGAPISGGRPLFFTSDPKSQGPPYVLLDTPPPISGSHGYALAPS